MMLLPKVEDVQPLRTVGELKAFIADIPDDMLLSGWPQYGNEHTFPITVEVEQSQSQTEYPPSWWDRPHLVISGYVQYAEDPDLENSWKELEPQKKEEP